MALQTPKYDPVTSLTGLPTEILLEIQTHMSYASRVALRSSCRALYIKLDDPNRAQSRLSSDQIIHTPYVKGYNMQDLLEIELWPKYNGARYRADDLLEAIPGRDFFACSLCLKIRSASKFSNAMMRQKRGKLGNATMVDKSARFCIECGVGRGICQPGTSLQFGGTYERNGVVCFICGIFKVDNYDSYGPPGCKTCRSCAGLDGVDVKAWDRLLGVDHL